MNRRQPEARELSRAGTRERPGVRRASRQRLSRGDSRGRRPDQRGNSADQLKQFVEAGGTLMVFMGEPVNSDNYNSILLPRGLLPVRWPSHDGGGDSRADFTSISNRTDRCIHCCTNSKARPTAAWNDRRFTPTGRSISRDGKAERVLDFQKTDKRVDPAITVQNLGAGHVITCATALARLDRAAWPTELRAAAARAAVRHDEQRRRMDERFRRR